MYLINAIGIRFDLSYEKIDGVSNTSISITAFNNSISNRELDEELYHRKDLYTFDDNVGSHSKQLSTELKSMYNNCIKKLSMLSDSDKLEYTKQPYTKAINNIATTFFSTSIADLVDKGSLSVTMLIPTGNRGCSIYGTIPINLRTNSYTASIESYITCSHQYIKDFPFMKYSYTKLLPEYIDPLEEYIKSYPNLFVRSIKTIADSIITLMNTVETRARLDIKPASSLKRAIEGILEDVYDLTE